MMIAMPDINWGSVLNKGFEWAQDALKKKTTGPLSKTPDIGSSSPAQSTPQSNMPAWLLPVAIAAGLLLMLGRKKRRR